MKIDSFFDEQLAVWDFARQNYEALQAARIKSFSFGNFAVNVQFNPARIVSSAAKTDANNIALRPCFLCGHNRPNEQQSIEYLDYEILVNPFPIFRNHFTIAHKQHQAQQIIKYLPDMLQLATEFSNYAVFYNGASCGASAPDHLHFQAVPSDCLPIIADYRRLKNTHAKILQNSNNLQIYEFTNYFRRVYCLEFGEISNVRDVLVDFLKQIDFTNESMLNLICYFDDNKWKLFVFPRRAFRPRQYFSANETEKLLVSPATVELSGVIVTALEKDFLKITKNDIISIYEQVS